MKTPLYSNNAINVTRTAWIVVVLVCGMFCIPFTAIALSNTTHSDDGIVQVRLGEVVQVSTLDSLLVISTGTSTIIGHYNDTTHIYFGTTESALISDIQEGSMIYLFGITSATNSSMSIEKIVIKNKSKLMRKSQKVPWDNFISRLLFDRNENRETEIHTKSSSTLEAKAEDFIN
jgi:hypothetical protein